MTGGEDFFAIQAIGGVDGLPHDSLDCLHRSKRVMAPD